MQSGKKDLFEEILGISIFRPFVPFYRKYKEGLLYLFFGGLTFILAIFLFVVLDKICGINALVANVISWICGVTFSFFTTRKWVFYSDNKEIKALWGQMSSFFAARALTLVLQEVLLAVFIKWCGLDSTLVKVVTEFINIIINYLVSKFVIFKKEK